MEKRPTNKEEYYLNIAREVARKSKCYRAMSGSVIVRDDQIVSAGYIGAPRKTKDCFERGNCLRNKLNVPRGQRYELCRSVHAEQNAIINAARAGVNVLGGDMYLYGERVEKDGTQEVMDMTPCSFCKRMVINAGLNRIVCSRQDGDINVFHVLDWIRDWQVGDIVDDAFQYGQGLKVYKEGEDPLKKEDPTSPKKQKQIIGVTGTYSAGKDTVAEYLKNKGFSHFSCSDILRDEAEKMGLEKNRDNLIKIGNDLRRQFGVGILGSRILEKIEKNSLTQTAVSSIRNPGEIEELKKSDSFYLIKIDAPLPLRYSRAKARGDIEDNVSFDRFKAQEESEMKSPDPANQQIIACMNMADFTIINDSTLTNLHAKIDQVLEKIVK
ncbi:AAA family ATPase [Candidatus Falkowbacteria bacterium]|nr:AAA family ATPase [Candidatus Falkowbacteria bacterium]